MRRAGDRLRVTAQLVHAEDGCQIWSERYDCGVRDVFDLEDELTQAIVRNLRLRLGSLPAAPAARRGEADFEARELHLRGRFALNRQTESDLRQAIRYFEQSAEAAPELAPPRVGLAEAYTLLAWYGFAAPREAMPRAKEHVEQALAIDAANAEARCLLGVIHAGYDWSWAAAKREFHQAVALGAGFAAVHFHYALDYLTPQGRLGEALREVRRAHALDPLSPLLPTAIGGCFLRQRDYQAAILQLEGAAAATPDFYHAHWTLGRALEASGELARAASALEQAALLSGGSYAVLGDLGHCYGLMGRRVDAEGLIDRIVASPTGYVSPLITAMILLSLGEREAFFERLARAVDERTRSLVWLNVDSRLDEVRQAPEVERAVAAVGLLGPESA